MRRHAIAAAALALAGAAPAHAGTYEVVSCGAAPGGANNAWSLTNSAPAQYSAATICPAGADQYGGLRVYDVLGSQNAQAGSRAQWTFTAPAGTRVVRWRYERWLGKDGTNSWDVYARLGNGVALDECAIPLGAPNCSRGAPGAGSPGALRDATPLDTSALAFGIRCAASGGTTCAPGGLTIHNAWAALYSSRITLREDSIPALGTPTGSLVDSSGWLDGAREVTFSATDGVGIANTTVRIDGVARSSTAHSCDFTYAVPCADVAAAAHSIDTTALADGEHSLRLSATDAAGNEASAPTRWILVDNEAPEISLTAPSGTTTSEQLFVSWHGSDAGAGIAGYDFDVATDGGPFVPRLVGTTATGIRLFVAAGHTYRFRVRATDGTGKLSPALASDSLHVLAPAPSQVEPQPSAGNGGGGEPSPPGPGGEGGAPAPAARVDPMLRIRSARITRGLLLLRAEMARAATGRVEVSLSKTRGRGAGRWTLTPRSGRLRLRARLRRGVPRTGIVTLRYRGDAAHQAATTRFTLTRR